MSFQTASKNR